MEINLNYKAIEESIYRLNSKNFSKRNNFQDFLNELNNDDTLNKQRIVFECFNTDKQFTKTHLAEMFINQTLDVMSNITFNDLKTKNTEIRIKYLDNTHVASTKNNDILYNNIGNLIESKCIRNGGGTPNLKIEQESYDYLIEHLTKERDKKIKTEKPGFFDYFTIKNANKFNLRYSHLKKEDLIFLKKYLYL